MTSWIMVNSRCVAGSSTGTREFSARRRTNKLTPTRLSDAPACGHAAASGVPRMPLKERSPAASTNEPGRRFPPVERQEQRRQDERRERDDGARAEDERRRTAVDPALANQLCKVGVQLEHRRAAPAGQQ